MKKNRIVWLMSIGVSLLICACHLSKKVDVFLPLIHPSNGHVLMALNPEFSIKTTDIAINKQYSFISTGKPFPMIGLLRVNDKFYRFMGGDYLRDQPLFALSHESCGWNGKYSFLNPDVGWEKERYDDSQWKDGMGAFGSEDHSYPIHSSWNANNIYVRRHVFINNVDILKDRKLYIRYACDDHIKLYCNGEYIFQENYTPQIGIRQLSDEIIKYLHNGDNVIAAQGINDGGGVLLDFGLYVEDKSYNEVDTAILKQIDMQATQTHYVFQCGNMELRLDFVLPALSGEPDMVGYPIGFITYHVESKEQLTDTEIIFDIDTEWMFDRHCMDTSIDDKWRIAKANDCFYLGMKAEETNYLYENGHVIISQQLCRDKANSGVLLLGYDGGRTIQYEGENLFSYWSRDGRKIEEIMKSIGDQYQALKEKCNTMDYQCYEKAMRSKGKKYVKHTILTYRDFLAGHYFVTSPSNELFCFGNSLGNVNEAYKYFPTLLFYNRIDCMKGLLNPIFEYSESADWVKKYPPYDIGNYPIVNRQVNTDDHGAEVAADMLVMTLAIVKEERELDYAEKHWKVLCQWADYLNEYMADDSNFSYEFPSANDERIVLGWMAYQELLQYK